MYQRRVMQTWRVDRARIRRGRVLNYVQDVGSQYVITVRAYAPESASGVWWERFIAETARSLNRIPEEICFGRKPAPGLVCWLRGLEIRVSRWRLRRTVFDIFLAHVRRDGDAGWFERWNRRAINGKSPQLRFFDTPLPTGRALPSRAVCFPRYSACS